MARRKKKERYIDRWRKQHKEIRFYLKKEDYETIEKLASKYNMTVKEYIIKYIEDVSKAYNEGYGKAIVDFIEKPLLFYNRVRAIYKGDIALFEVPCSICGKPMIFNHKKINWESEAKPTLLRAFENWHHVQCEKIST